VTFDGLPHDKERQSIPYFGTAVPDTVLEPVVAFNGAKIEKFGYNGVEI
jgi:isopenicillin N synthase-like dioxygenase